MPAQFETLTQGSVGFPTPGLVISKPAGVVQGDFLLAILYGQQNVGGGPGTGWAFPGGWTKVFDDTVGSPDNRNLGWGWLPAGASEPSSYTFTRTAPSDSALGIIMRVSGIDLASPIAGNGETFQVTSSSPRQIVCPDVVASVAGSLIVRGHGAFKTTTPTSALPVGGYTQRSDFLDGITNATHMSAYTIDTNQPAAGPTGPVTITLAPDSGFQHGWGFTIALAPLTSGGGGGMGDPGTAEPQRETVQRGLPIKNPFGGRMRRNACLCIGKCVCS